MYFVFITYDFKNLPLVMMCDFLPVTDFPGLFVLHSIPAQIMQLILNFILLFFEWDVVHW